MKIYIPKFCLVLLIGSSGSGKSTFAKKYFTATEIVSSDFCRGLVSDDENNQFVSGHAFDLLHFIVEKRLILGRLTVIDATNVQENARKELIKIANRNNCPAAAIALNLSEDICLKRDKLRKDRCVGERVISNHIRLLKKSLDTLETEGFKYIYVFKSQEEMEDAEIVRI
ncbi:AAA family ATPase [Clostridium swellfunianum]|uniref:AAA family ATPase n=1 Tax=Clostridium swellfunianum TaxID=1367462 RepID=UPI00202F3E1D|nr:AAA family ATPase [Clostridium swellfunianum]